MRMRTIFFVAVVAIILGVASPYLADPTPDMSRALYAWFYWLPGLVGSWLWPESDIAFMALSMAVYAVQYFAAFALASATVPLARIVRDFMRPHKHRDGLLQPRT